MSVGLKIELASQPISDGSSHLASRSAGELRCAGERPGRPARRVAPLSEEALVCVHEPGVAVVLRRRVVGAALLGRVRSVHGRRATCSAAKTFRQWTIPTTRGELEHDELCRVPSGYVVPFTGEITRIVDPGGIVTARVPETFCSSTRSETSSPTSDAPVSVTSMSTEPDVGL